MTKKIDAVVEAETERRRTFAIISHPDAGKTTLTEKLLLYSGMIRTAGMVGGRKSAKAASSDWMEMEQERGISITASAMQFEYQGCVINVLDTPGHQDFSEDTYRTLTAADSAIMVIDAAKGVELQTRKLFAVCAMRKIPVLTFINKMDLPGRDPFELIAEVEEVLGIQAAAYNWPIGSGREFKGVADVADGTVTLFNRAAAGGSQRAEAHTMALSEAISSGKLSETQAKEVEFELELLRTAGNKFTSADFLTGKVTLVFFGSALTNFGLEPFFEAFVKKAPCPSVKLVDLDNGEEEIIDPVSDPFSAFVFKVQANMDPRHRDSVAFLRVCSGRFERDQLVHHHRLNKSIRLSRGHKMFAGERDTLDVAYPGDIVGVINPGAFMIGDTVSLNGGFKFKPLPQFSPEVVARIRPKDVIKRKAFDKGILQLAEEGAVQVLTASTGYSADKLIAAVGRLQFEVLQYRLKNDYQVDTILEMLPYECGAWLVGDVSTLKLGQRTLIARDRFDRPVVLFRSERERQFAADENPNHKLEAFVQ